MQCDKNDYRGDLAGLEGVVGKKAVGSETMTVKNCGLLARGVREWLRAVEFGLSIPKPSPKQLPSVLVLVFSEQLRQ